MNLNEARLLGQIERGSDNCSNVDIRIDVPADSFERNYLGISAIGRSACSLWVDYHKPDWPPTGWPIEGQSNRIFRLGKILEEEIVYYITKGGGKVSGRQDEYSDFNGRFKGHCDGHWEQTHVLEIKSANEDGYDKAVSTRNVKESHYVYYSQCTMYMYYSGLRKAMLVFYGKNRSNIHAIEIPYNENDAKFLRVKAMAILSAKSPCRIPDQIRTDDCNVCEFVNYCRS